MKRWIGIYLMVVGVLHTAVGVIVFGPTLRQLLAEGMWNTLGRSPERQLSFWFLMLGLALILLGAMVDWIETTTTRPPGRLAVGLAIITVAGLVMMPLSPFWLLLPATVALAIRSRRPASR